MTQDSNNQVDQEVWDLAAGLASALRAANMQDPFGKCLVVSAHIGCMLAERGVESVAVRGTYNLNGVERAHWWLHVPSINLRIDATREQFEPFSDQADFLGEIGDDPRYLIIEEFPALWDRTRALEETKQACAHSGAAQNLSDQLFAEGDAVMEHTSLPRVINQTPQIQPSGWQL